MFLSKKSLLRCCDTFRDKSFPFPSLCTLDLTCVVCEEKKSNVTEPVLLERAIPPSRTPASKIRPFYIFSLPVRAVNLLVKHGIGLNARLLLSSSSFLSLS